MLAPAENTRTAQSSELPGTPFDTRVLRGRGCSEEADEIDDHGVEQTRPTYGHGYDRTESAPTLRTDSRLSRRVLEIALREAYLEIAKKAPEDVASAATPT